MNNVKVALAAGVLTVGNAVSGAAADMPAVSGFGPLGGAQIENVRLECNGFGRCFRVGPFRGFHGPQIYPVPRVFYPAPRVVYPAPRVVYPAPRVVYPAPRVVYPAPRVVYPAPRAFAPPVYEGPDYVVRRGYRERPFDGPEYEYRRTEEFRRSDGQRQFGDFRRPDGERPREEWSREYGRFEGGGERD